MEKESGPPVRPEESSSVGVWEDLRSTPENGRNRSDIAESSGEEYGIGECGRLIYHVSLQESIFIEVTSLQFPASEIEPIAQC